MERIIVHKKLETEYEIIEAKKLIVEHIQWLNTDLCFQNIDDELTRSSSVCFFVNSLFQFML
jgi:hypothetical protein